MLISLLRRSSRPHAQNLGGQRLRLRCRNPRDAEALVLIIPPDERYHTVIACPIPLSPGHGYADGVTLLVEGIDYPPIVR